MSGRFFLQRKITVRLLPGILMSSLLMGWLSVYAADNASGQAGYRGSPENVLSGVQLVEALREGGYILYFRHGMTNHETYDSDRDNLQNCDTQRLLSDQGRQEMHEVGRVIQALDIRVSTVLTSPYCRCIDTARLAFGDEYRVINDLRHTVNADESTARQRAAVLTKLLGSAPITAGTNTVISGHTANLQEASGIWPKPEGVAIIFKPHSFGEFTYIATVEPGQWNELLSATQASVISQPSHEDKPVK